MERVDLGKRWEGIQSKYTMKFQRILKSFSFEKCLWFNKFPVVTQIEHNLKTRKCSDTRNVFK